MPYLKFYNKEHHEVYKSDDARLSDIEAQIFFEKLKQTLQIKKIYGIVWA